MLVFFCFSPGLETISYARIERTLLKTAVSLSPAIVCLFVHFLPSHRYLPTYMRMPSVHAYAVGSRTDHRQAAGRGRDAPSRSRSGGPARLCVAGSRSRQRGTQILTRVSM